MDRLKAHEVHQEQYQVVSLMWPSPMQQHTLPGSSFAEKNLGNSDGQQVKDETVACHWRDEGKVYTGLH